MINLIHFGGPALTVIGLLGIVLPLLLYGLSLLLQAVHLPYAFAQRLMVVSLALGGALLVAFIILLIVEQIQDARLYQVYRRGREKRLLLPDGHYECQFCGCRALREFEHICPVCGKTLQ